MSVDAKHGLSEGRYTQKILIGQGGFGQVYIARDQNNNSNVIIKEELSSSCDSVLMKEAKILNYLNLR